MKWACTKVFLVLIGFLITCPAFSESYSLVTPGRRRVKSKPVMPREAHEILSGPARILPQMAALGGTGTEATPEIVELARGLRNDPNLIYKFVHDHIDYTPIFGSVKGATMTLLDRSGNDFDQASLLMALLRQGGYDPNYVYGVVQLMPEGITNWLGVPADPDVIGWLLGSAGIPGQIWIYGDGSLAYVDLDHVWVKVNIDGTEYVFDPSIKNYNYTLGIDLKSVMNYNPNTFLADANSGAIIDPNYVKDINTPNIIANFRTYSTNLASYIENTNPAATLKDIIGDRSIVPVSEVPRQTSLPYELSVDYEWTEIPDTYKTVLRIQHRGIDVTVYSSDAYGKRLTIFYNESDHPVLALDGEVLATGTSTAPGTRREITLTVDHPYAANGGTYCDETQTFNITAGGSYYLVNGWADTGRKIVEKHRKVLKENRHLGNSEMSEPVLGESLTLLGLTYLAECWRTTHLCDQIAGTTTINHHTLGVCGQYDSPYFDMPMGLASIISDTNDPSKEEACFFASNGHNSAFEWGVIEQLQPYGAISTIKLIDISNSKSDKIFNANSSNYYTDIKPQLMNYSFNELFYVIEPYIDAGYRLILPQDGDLSEGDWVGLAFIALSPSGGIGYIISGGFNGGKGTTPGDVDNEGAATSQPEVHNSEYETLEPIDLFTGDYLYKREDIAVGSRLYPFRLTFRRSYNSHNSLENGPLGLGWKHNLNIFATNGSDGFQGLGSDSALDAAGAIVELYVNIDLLGAPKTNTRLVVATLAQRWFMDRLIDNVVTVDQPGNTMQFVKLPDDSYNPPPGEAAVLSIEGNSTYLLKTKHGEYLEFDPNGLIVSWSDPNNTVSYIYDVNNRLLQVSNEFGRSLNFSYDTNDINHISSVTDSTGRTVSYGYDGSGNLVTITDVSGYVTTFEYDPNNGGRITKIYYPSDPNNFFVTNIYDSLGRVASQTNACGYTYQYYYSGYRTEEVDPCGYSDTHYFNDQGDIISETDPLCNTTTYQYDGQQRRTLVTYPEENATQYAYDANHNVTQITQIPKPGSAEPNIVASFTYEPNFNHIATHTDPNGNVTTFSYYANGKLQRITEPNVNSQIPQTHFTYNSHGQVETITDAEGTVTKYEYDPTGNLLRTIVDYGAEPDNLNIMTEMTYNAAGDVNSITDPRDNTTTFEYDPMRRLTKTTAPAPFNYITRYEYYPDGNLKLMQRETGDSNHPWQTISYTYTPTGKLETVTDPNGNVTQYEYDALDRLWKVTDAENSITKRLYDAAGWLYKVIDAEDHDSVTYSYAPNGQLESLTDAKGNTTTYQYDGLDRLVKTTYPDDSNEQFGYDAVGNIVEKKTRAGQVITYSYDPLNRLETKILPSPQQIQYEYDLVGRLVQVTDGIGAIQHSFDSIGRLTEVTYPDGKIISYKCDAAGNRTQLTYPDGSCVTYEYDPLNRLIDIRDEDSSAVVHYDYDALSRRATAQYANGTNAVYVYDITDRLLSLDNQMNPKNRSFTYSYDSVGNKLTMTVNGTDVHRYNYDRIYQLTDVDYTDGHFTSDTTFNYDPVGNRESVINGAITSYVTNSLNQYTSVGGVEYSYDNNGNLTSDGTNSYTYDAEDRLVAATTPRNAVCYQYDPFGRRIAKNVNGKVTKYLYDGDQVICEYDHYGRLRRKFLYGTGIDETVRMTNVLPSADITGGGNVDFDDYAVLGLSWWLDNNNPGFDPNADLNCDDKIDFKDVGILAELWLSDGQRSEDYFYHYDGLGSVIALTDSADNIIESYSYDVFGQPNTTSSVGNPYLFTGRRHNTETGLYYYRARYFDPYIGRFLQIDPIGYFGGVNIYTYVGNNPTNWIDPYGLCKVDDTRKPIEDEFDWWGTFWHEFGKGAHETALGFLEMLPGWTYETTKFWYAYEGDIRTSQSYWEGRATYGFSGKLIEYVISTQAISSLEKLHTLRQMGRLPNSMHEMIRFGQKMAQEGKSIKEFKEFMDFKTVYDLFKGYSENQDVFLPND